MPRRPSVTDVDAPTSAFDKDAAAASGSRSRPRGNRSSSTTTSTSSDDDHHPQQQQRRAHRVRRRPTSHPPQPLRRPYPIAAAHEAMPLLSGPSTPSTSAAKAATSPPPLPPAAGDMSSDSQQLKRPRYGTDRGGVDDHQRLLEDPTEASSSNAATALQLGRVVARVRLWDVALALAVAVGMITLALIHQRHAGGDGVLHAPNHPHHWLGRPLADHRVRPRLRPTTTVEDPAARRAALAGLVEDLERLRAHEIRQSRNGELNTTLRVTATRFTEGPIAFWTRAYEHSIPGPLLSLRPGDTLNVHLVNDLGPNAPGEWTPNTFHHPNTTNLHVHGMHVDPTGIADNVLRELHPGETLFAQIPVPATHPRGLFHYHPHYHGSVFLQMAAGMVGPIVVEDDDHALPEEYQHLRRHVLVLQEFRFDGGLGSDLRKAARASRSRLEMRPEYTSKVLLDARVRRLFPTVHRPSELLEDVPMSETLLALDRDMEQPTLSRFQLVNGQYLPKIEVQPKENVMLRLLNAGPSATLELSIPGCRMHVVATDGLYLPSPRESRVLLLSGGARMDVVINCSPNDDEDPDRGALRPVQSIKHKDVDDFLGHSSDVFEGVLAFIHVSGPTRDTPVVTSTPPPSPLYAQSLLKLSAEDRAKMDPEPFQFVFSMGTEEVKDGFPYKNYLINHASFNLTTQRNMTLDAVQEWVIINQQDESGKETTKNHPFHLHTNAFQVVAMSHGEGVDYKVGDWRDVIAVPTPGNVTIRFRPVDYKGPIVAHCHILSHSDEGMVARVDIV